MPPKNNGVKTPGKQKYKNIPTALSPANIDEVDAIAKAEGMTRSEIIRKAIETFAFNYRTDQLDQRQLQLEKRMKMMETALRALLAKAIRINGQVLFFTTLLWSHGVPKQRLTGEGFNKLFDASQTFAGDYLKSKAAGKMPEGIDDPGAEGE